MTTTRVGGSVLLAATVCAVLWLVGAAADARPALAPAAKSTSQPTSVPAVSAERIAALISQLGDDSAAKRQQAARELAKIGAPAISALRKATASDDPEIAAQASALLRASLQMQAGQYLRWKVELPEGYTYRLVMAKDAAVVHRFHDDKGTLHAISLTDGKPKWEFEVGHIVTAPFVRPRPMPSPPTVESLGDILLVHEHTGEAVKPDEYTSQLIALSAATGDVLWRRDIDTSFCTYFDGEHLGYTRGFEDFRLGRLSLKDGTALMEKEIPGMVVETSDGGFLHPTSRVEKGVFLASRYDSDNQSTYLAALDFTTGEMLWEKHVDSPAGFLRKDDDSPGVLVFSHSKENMLTLTTYDPRSGEEVTAVTLSKEASSLGVLRVLPKGRFLQKDRSTDAVMVHDLASGKEVWRYTPRKRDDDRPKPNMQLLRNNDIFFMPPPPTVHNGMVLLGVDDGLFALDLNTGKPLWKYPMEHHVVRNLETRGDVVYLVARDLTDPGEGDTAKFHLHALDLTKARQLGPPEDEVVERNE
ncbi:MAG: PQQ-binding-like beta-propeller repeat protein [Phycisphaerae bacterium]|nr:PQQ-binding-like beta-propeller repeat protein [Phycisphaerae bacterium]